MSEAVAAADASDDLLGSDFILEMVRQMRAIDTYGTHDDWPVEKLLDPFVLTREQRRDIPVIGDLDEATLRRVKAFYNALCALIEKECGLMAVPMINVSHEGFGRALITVGKLVVLDKTLRDVHRFSFASLSKMKEEADKLLAVALKTIGEHPKAAGI
jgi:probable nitrogen fixation protein